MDSQKLFRLDGRIAFISAARGHLGRAMTRALAEAGAHVIVNGRDDAALADYERELAGPGFSVRTRRLRRRRFRGACGLFSPASRGWTCWSTTRSR